MDAGRRARAVSVFRRRPPVAAYGAPVGSAPPPQRTSGPTGLRGMRMRQYRRNMVRIFRKNPKFAEVYAKRMAELTAPPRRSRTGALMLAAAILGMIAAYAARLVQ